MRTARSDPADRLGEFVGSDDRFRLVVEGVLDYAIFMLDPAGQVVTWNTGAERINGYAAAEIIGRNFSCFYTQEDVDLGKPKEVLRIAKEHGRAELEQRRVRKDGTIFQANLVITALHDRFGKLVGFSEVSREVTQRVESESRYRGLFEAAPDAMVVVNQDGEIVLLNLQAERQFGYRRDELLGQPVTNIIPEGFAERLRSDALRSAAEALAQQIGTGIELVGRRKNKSTFPIEITLSPHDDAEGTLVTAAIRDISVRNAAQLHLMRMTRELSCRYRMLDSAVEGTPDLIYIKDLGDRLVLTNNACARLFQRSVNEMVGISMRELWPEASYQPLAESDREVVLKGTAHTFEHRAELDGVQRTYLTTSSPYRDAHNRIIGTIGISRDITEIKRLDEARLLEPTFRQPRSSA